MRRVYVCARTRARTHTHIYCAFDVPYKSYPISTLRLCTSKYMITSTFSIFSSILDAIGIEINKHGSQVRPSKEGY